MADQTSSYPNGRSDYHTTPVLSPAHSIAFSDSIHMGQGHFDMPGMQYGVFPDASLVEPRGWYQQSDYATDRVNPAAQQALQHAHHPVYEHPGSSSTAPVTTSVNYTQTPHIAEPIPQWIPTAIPNHQQISAPVIQPTQAWQQQHHVHPHYERIEQSRHNSIASTSVATSMSTAPTTVDETNECLSATSLHGKHNLPLHDHHRLQHYDRSRIPSDQSAVLGTTESIPTGLNPHIQSPSSSEDQSSDSQVQSLSPIAPTQNLTVQANAHASVDNIEEPVKRKRGRPRMIRDPEDAKRPRQDRPSRRQPHNEIERKYREGLNAEMERLRDAIPRLPQLPVGASQKASKAQVLKTAVEEIQRLNAVAEEAVAKTDKLQSDLERANKKIAMLERQAPTVG